MDAIILAAGLGTRLRPHTLVTPKPLLPVCGRPILDWIIAALPRDVRRVIVVTHYLAAQIDDYMQRQDRVADYITVFQSEPRGTGDAFRACRGHVSSSRVMVLNGDDLYSARDLAHLTEKPTGLLAHPVDEPRRYGIVFPKPDGTLDRLIEKPDLDGPQLANIGAYLFPRDALELDLPLSSRNEYEITDAVSMVAARQPFHIVKATTWLPIGNEEQWKNAEAMELETMLGA